MPRNNPAEAPDATEMFVTFFNEQLFYECPFYPKVRAIQR